MKWYVPLSIIACILSRGRNTDNAMQPYYQPLASLQAFNRTLYGWDMATGTKKVTADLSTEGDAESTHTNSYSPLPSATATGGPSKKFAPGRYHWRE
jgi:hypothetical protein